MVGSRDQQEGSIACPHGAEGYSCRIVVKVHSEDVVDIPKLLEWGARKVVPPSTYQVLQNQNGVKRRRDLSRSLNFALPHPTL